MPLVDWQTYPEAGTPEAVAATGAQTGQMPWMAYPEAPGAAAPAPVQPTHPPSAVVAAFGETPVFTNPEDTAAALKAQQDVSRAVMSGATFGLSDKAGAAIRAGAEKLVGAKEAFADLYHKELAGTRAAAEKFAQENPAGNVIAQGAGMAATAPLLPAGRAVTTLGKVAEGAGLGGLIGGISGFAATNDESAGKDLVGTAAGAATGAATGGTLGAVGDRVVKPVMDWVARRFSPEAAESQAVKVIAKRMQQDAAAGGPSAQDMLDLLNAAPGKPQSLVDVAGENTRALAGRIARTPGEGRQVATEFLNQRDVGAGGRLEQDVSGTLGGGQSAYSANQALMEARSAAAQEPYELAMRGGSIAPLEDQLRSALTAATGQKGQIARQIAAIEQSNPGALIARGAAGADVRAQYLGLHSQLQQAENDRLSIMQMFQRAKSDAASNAPGAVWNPRIQQFLDDPILQSGLSRGMEIQRLESLAQGRPFNPTEYAITGTDQAGKPIVGTVPNMRTLDMGKRGLDAIVGDNRDPITGRLNSYGRAVDQARRAYVAELDKANPAYAAARASWSGPSASMDALKAGQAIFNKDPEEIGDEMQNLAPGDQEFYRLGAADTIKKQLAKTGMGGDEAKRIVGNQWTQRQLQPLFRSPDDYQRFIDAATAENRMFETRRNQIGGSDTARRVAEDNAESGAVGHAVRGAAALMEGAPVAATLSGLKALGALTKGASPQVNAAAARLLFNPEPVARQSALARIIAAQGARNSQAVVGPLAAIAGRSYPALASVPYLPGTGQ